MIRQLELKIIVRVMICSTLVLRIVKRGNHNTCDADKTRLLHNYRQHTNIEPVIEYAKPTP